MAAFDAFHPRNIDHFHRCNHSIDDLFSHRLNFRPFPQETYPVRNHPVPFQDLPFEALDNHYERTRPAYNFGVPDDRYQHDCRHGSRSPHSYHRQDHFNLPTPPRSFNPPFSRPKRHRHPHNYRRATRFQWPKYFPQSPHSYFNIPVPTPAPTTPNQFTPDPPSYTVEEFETNAQSPKSKPPPRISPAFPKTPPAPTQKKRELNPETLDSETRCQTLPSSRSSTPERPRSDDSPPLRPHSSPPSPKLPPSPLSYFHPSPHPHYAFSQPHNSSPPSRPQTSRTRVWHAARTESLRAWDEELRKWDRDLQVWERELRGWESRMLGRGSEGGWEWVCGDEGGEGVDAWGGSRWGGERDDVWLGRAWEAGWVR